MARTGLMTAGFALSAILVLAASCDVTPPRAVKAIAPPKPETTSKAAMAPKPESEPQTVAAQPSPRPQPAPDMPSARQPQSVRTAHHTRHGGSLAHNSPLYRYDNNRPMSGPIYDPGRSTSHGCDEACRYRAWFRDYSAWYQAYGRYYPEAPPRTSKAPAPSAGDRDQPRTAYQPGEIRVWSERDRLDPWHGYDGRDGPQNGY